VIAKAHNGDRLRRTFATMQRLWNDDACRSALLSFPRPIVYDDVRRVLWQEALPGSSFWDRYPDIDVPDTFRAMARAAAVLHTCGFAPRGRTLEPLPEGRGALDGAEAALARRHAALLDRARRALAELPPVAPVSLHGDFHPGQFLIDGLRLGLTDFDTAGWGDPAYDVGRFASHVYLKALERNLDPSSFEASLLAFAEEYVQHAPAGIELRRLRVHVAAQLVGRRVYKALRHEVAASHAGRLLAIAEEQLA
jgi:aminoglycoside phosphotransferase (APT) family kinase protein